MAKGDVEVELKELGKAKTKKDKTKKERDQQQPQHGKIEEFNEDKYFGATRLEDDNPADEEEDTLIAMKNVHKTYLLGVEGVPALRGVSLAVKRGEFVCIFGTSGGGKTTMLNILGTIDKPTKGELKLCGVRINSNTKDADLSHIRLQKLGFVFQTFNLLSSLTAQENVEMPMILNGILSPAERKQRAKELLSMVGMAKRLDHVPSQLSGGEQQRVTIARAIANSPELLLLDEPTGDLDTVNTLIVMQLLTELNRKNNITMVMVTHDVALKGIADRIIWMRDGKIQRIETNSPQKREDAVSKITEELDAIQSLKKKKGKKGKGVTEFRAPTDYKTYSPKSQANGVVRPESVKVKVSLSKGEQSEDEDGSSSSYTFNEAPLSTE